LHLSKEEHIDIIQKKTASLFELPCKLGITLAGADIDRVEALVRYSKNIGIAFQLIDDILDLVGDPAKTGKKPGTDLREGVYTYATLHALNSATLSDRLSELLMIEDLNDSHILDAIEIIRNSGGMEIARNKAEEHIQEAINSLSFFPDNATKKSLINLAQFTISRDQ
jgi:geranylgeranyl pyrophosphate synthase